MTHTGLANWGMQIPISAGHEFAITTDANYKDICDDKYLYVDYVSGKPPSFIGVVTE